jgi:transposase-like protein
VVETTMELSSWLRKQLEQASPDLLRAMVQEFAEALMGAEADAVCGAPYGERIGFRNSHAGAALKGFKIPVRLTPRLGDTRG